MIEWRTGDTIGCGIVLGATAIVLFFLGFIARGC